MNIKRLKAEAERLRNWDKTGYRFDMSRLLQVGSCGTACCIAGDVWLKEHPNVDWRDRPNNIVGFVEDFLGLTDEQVNWLFVGHFIDSHLEDITPQQAAEAIELLISNEGVCKDLEGAWITL